MAQKENRCWPGYEPVKGKKQHEQGSCKKKPASKSTASEKKVQDSRKKQLDDWSREHPQSPKSAAQHLSGPGTEARTPAKGAKSKAGKAKPAPRTKSSSATN